MSIAYQIATLGGAGLSKRAPGTIGSMVSLVLWAPLVLLDVSWLVRLLATIFVFALGFWSIKHSLAQFKGSDPQSIVVDEAAGMGMTLCLCHPSLWTLLLGFALFRFFDILKPWPVNWADRQIKGPLGIMLDDLLAGFYALLMLSFLDVWLLPLLGIVP